MLRPSHRGGEVPWTVIGKRIGWAGVFLLGCAWIATEAQEPAPNLMPRIELAAGGVVHAIVRDAQDGLIVAGNFTSVLGEPRANLARLRPDGTLDAGFAPDISGGEVRAIAVAPDGAIFIGGHFTRVGAVARRGLAKLDAFGTLDLQWSPSAYYEILALAVSANGSVFVGGTFDEIGGVSRRGLAKLSGHGAGVVDPAWKPDARVANLTIGPDGWVYVTGGFSRVGGEYRHGIARLAQDGAGNADPHWNAAADGFVRGVDFAADGSLYVFGSFSSIGGQARRGLAKLLPGTPAAAAPEWAPDDIQGVDTVFVGTDGWIHVAARPESRLQYDPRRRLVRLSADDASAALGTVPEMNFAVRAIAVVGDDRRIVGGEFTLVNGNHRLGLAAFDQADQLGPAIDIEAPATVTAIEPDPAGGAYVAGNFWKADGLPRFGLLRVDAGGALDPDWTPRAQLGITGFAGHNALALHPASDKLHVVTWFPELGGESISEIGRVSASGDGALDLGWRASFNDTIMAVETDDLGAVYAGGLFDLVSGVPRRYLVKLSAVDGSVDPSWNPAPNGFVNVLRHSGNALHVGGHFNSGISPITIGGQANDRFARLSISNAGDADPAWQFGLANSPWSIVSGANGFLMVDGNHAIYRVSTESPGLVSGIWADIPSNRPLYVNTLAVDDRWLYAAGMLTPDSVDSSDLRRYPLAVSHEWDSSWDPAPNGSVTAMAVDGRGTLFVGGAFDRIGGQRRTGLAAFSESIFEDGFDGRR